MVFNKIFFFFVALFLVLGMNTLYAQNLPNIEIPNYGLKEETRTLTESEIAELKLYAKDIKLDLQELLDQSSQRPPSEAPDYLQSEMKKIVSNYQERANSFVRYTINRSLVLTQIINEEVEANDNMKDNVQLRLLRQSLKMAVLYSDFDFSRYNEFELKTYARFGADYYSLLVELSKSLVDASAQYKIMIASLEFLQWDLYREVAHVTDAPVITKIYYFLKRQKNLNNKSDFEYVQDIRQIKKFITQLPIRPYLNSVDAHEIESMVSEAIAKNKDFKITSPFIKGEEIILADGNYEGMRLLTESPVIYDRPFYSLESLSHIVFVKEVKKNTIISSLEMFRQKGCLLEKSLCVGESIVSTSNGAATIIGVQSFGNRILAKTDTGKIFAAYSGGIYRRVGCSAKLNVCVGEKVVMRREQKYEVKTVTAISEDNRYGLFLTGDSLYDNKFEVASIFMFLGKL